MFGVFETYYDDVSRTGFDKDLDEKNHVILLVDADTGAVKGFSTLLLFTVTAGGSQHRGVFSGDTVIDKDYWGGGALGRAFTAYLLYQWSRVPSDPLWWFLISKGYKTYLLMANNFPDHFPRHEVETPPDVQQIMDAFATELFPAYYRPDRGVLVFDAPMGRVRDGVAPITEEMRASNPRIAFFDDQNPGHEYGEELVCVAKMSLQMPAKYLLKRMVGPLRRGLFGSDR